MRKIFIAILAVILCFTMVPEAALAAENGDMQTVREENMQGTAGVQDAAQEDMVVMQAAAQEDAAGAQAAAQEDVAVMQAAAQEDAAGTQTAAQEDAAGTQDAAQEDAAGVQDAAQVDAAGAQADRTEAQEDSAEEEPFEIIEPEEESVDIAESETEVETADTAEGETEEELLETSLPKELYEATLEADSFKYTGQKIKPAVTVTALKKGEPVVLEKDVDYTVKYKNNTDAGTATAVVTGIGRYTGTLKADFVIKPLTIKTFTLKNASKVYSGKAITQSKTAVVTAKVDGQELVLENGKDYVITYENNTEVGMATATAKGIGNFKSSLTAQFRIIPAAPTMRYLSLGTKRFTARWYEQSVQTSGYQLQYALDAAFTDGKTTISIRDPKQVSGTVKSLTAGKKYYVRLRTYKKVSGVNYYSKWSNVKSIKLTYNYVTVSGSGPERTVIIHNPKSIQDPQAAVWSRTGDQDDIYWYELKKHTDGSYRGTITAAWLDHSGTCYVHCYSGDDFIGEYSISFTEEELAATENTVYIEEDGVQSIVYLLHPKKTYIRMHAAVWSETNGQDDLEWVQMTKKSDGSWSTDTNLTNILHSGLVNVHVYAGGGTRFLGEADFTVAFGMEPCTTEEEYIERIAPAVQRVCKKYGYLPSVLIAQSCLENGYGIPAYWDNPEISGLIYYNNMVGLKSELLSASWEDYTVWNGESIVKKTPEVYDGVSVIITDSFRIYDSIEQSFADYLLFMTYASNYGVGGKPKYGTEVTSITTPSRLIKEVSKRGYATGTTYPTSVMRIINKHDLTKYDDLTDVQPTSYGP